MNHEQITLAELFQIFKDFFISNSFFIKKKH